MSCEMGAPAIEETLGPLLNVLAQSLDVQEVFARISALARQTVPHDCLLFGLVSEGGECYRVVAVSQDDQRAALLGTTFAPTSPGLAQEGFAIFRNLRMLPGKSTSGSQRRSERRASTRGLQASRRSLRPRAATRRSAPLNNGATCWVKPPRWPAPKRPCS